MPAEQAFESEYLTGIWRRQSVVVTEISADSAAARAEPE
jgi:hypothetical protein